MSVNIRVLKKLHEFEQCFGYGMTEEQIIKEMDFGRESTRIAVKSLKDTNCVYKVGESLLVNNVGAARLGAWD